MLNRNYSYFIIKPDGIRRFPEIAELVEKEFTSVRYYKIDDFQEVIKKIYYKHYQKKGETFVKSFEEYLYALDNVYGNEAIAIIVAQNVCENSYEDFIQKVFSTKILIRDKFVNNDIAIATNYSKSTEEPNYIKFVTKQGKQTEPRILSELGHHRLSNLNVIHSPDPTIKDTLTELKILCEEKIIEEERMLEPNMIKEAKQYRSVAGCCKEYKDEKPDISGFVKSEIEQLEM